MDYAALVGSHLTNRRDTADWPLFDNAPKPERARLAKPIAMLATVTATMIGSAK